MASAFQESKLRGMFAAFDADGDGYLREEDFTALIARWSRLPGVGPGTELRARVEALLMGWWAALLETGDTNGDGAIDMGELLALVDRLPAMVADVTATADTVFDAVDSNGDGVISPRSTAGSSRRGTGGRRSWRASSSCSTSTATAISAGTSSGCCGGSSGSATTRRSRATGSAAASPPPPRRPSPFGSRGVAIRTETARHADRGRRVAGAHRGASRRTATPW